MVIDESAEPRLVLILRNIDQALGWVEQMLLALFLVMLVGVGVLQAIATKAGHNFIWSFEVIRFSVFFIAMTGAALSAQTERLISLDLIPRLLPPLTRARLKLFVRLFTILICIMVIIGGVSLSKSAAHETHHLIPHDSGLLALPIGAGLIGIHLLLHSLIDLTYLRRGALPPNPSLSAGH